MNTHMVMRELNAGRADLTGKLAAIDTAITVVGQLNGAGNGLVRKGRKTMSAAARRKIGAAQRARWAKARRAQA